MNKLGNFYYSHIFMKHVFQMKFIGLLNFNDAIN